MSLTHQIQDYLRTQALHIPLEAVTMSMLATQAVLNHAPAHIDEPLLTHEKLPELFAQHLDEVKSLFMALDSMCTRHAVHSAVIYGYMPEWGQLYRLARLGMAVADCLPVNDTMAQQSIAVRTALSGWANVVESVPHWLALGELTGEQGEAMCQISLPICGEDGNVFGVVWLMTDVSITAEMLADWVGLTLAILPILREYSDGAVD